MIHGRDVALFVQINPQPYYQSGSRAAWVGSRPLCSQYRMNTSVTPPARQFLWRFILRSEQGRVKKGDLILLAAVGAVITGGQLSCDGRFERMCRPHRRA